MTRIEPPQTPGSGSPPPENGNHFTVEALFRVTRAFLIPFLLSWVLAYLGGEWANDWMYYAGLVGVGLSIIGLLLWLLHQ